MHPEANHRNDEPPRGATPSDDDLIAYLLGTASGEDRGRVENWLAADANHGDRLCDWASVVLLASETAPVVGPGAIHSPTAETTPSRRRIAAFLVLAVSLVMLVFSLDGFREDASANGRVAMAWAESLLGSSEAEIDSDVSHWLLEPGAALDSSEVPGLHDLVGEDMADSATAFGFSSGEPPEWLLAAVLEMQSSDPQLDASEDKL